jgi:hypothetical protein
MCRASIKIDGSSATERIITVDGPTDAIFKVRNIAVLHRILYLSSLVV